MEIEVGVGWGKLVKCLVGGLMKKELNGWRDYNNTILAGCAERLPTEVKDFMIAGRIVTADTRRLCAVQSLSMHWSTGPDTQKGVVYCIAYLSSSSCHRSSSSPL